MAKPRLIILIRHGQSEGNKNREIHQSTPDHRVKLTEEGRAQAREAGHRLRNMLRPTDTLHFFTSPYRRTRETTEGILDTLTSDSHPGPSPFRRSNIKVYEEPRLREQDFGNFQPCSAEMERMWQERADYGHFFYRIPNGESAADAYDRVSGFNESLWRQFGEDDFASVCVLVTHGLMSRVFLMKWYHFTVEYFEDLRNVNHCEFLVMRKQDNGKYQLENQLRTWSDLRRERALKEEAAARGEGRDKDKDKDKEKEKAAMVPRSPSAIKLERSKTYNVPRRWGGCPNGCNHSRHYVKKREDLEVLRQRDYEHAEAATSTTGTGRRQRHKQAISSDDGEDEDESGHESDAAPQPPLPEIGITRTTTTTITASKNGTPINHDELSSSPEAHFATPSSSNTAPEIDAKRLSLLHIGRDGGGTYSGHASTVGSDADTSEDEHHRHSHQRPAHQRLNSLNARIRIANAELLQEQLEKAAAEKDADAPNGERRRSESEHAFVNRLGDAPPRRESVGTDEDGEDLDRAEAEDRSIQGSVY